LSNCSELSDDENFKSEMYTSIPSKIDDYVNKRFVRQVNWYEKYAKRNMLKFYFFQALIIISGALIPIFNLYDIPSAERAVTPSNVTSINESTSTDGDKSGNDSSKTIISNLNIRVISSMLAAIIVIATSFVQLTKAQQSWLLFRETTETLKREYHLFCNKAGHYSQSKLGEEQRNRLFIDTAETIMAQEGSKYYLLRRQVDQDQKSESSTS
jgi:hypothetical protein